MFRILTGAGIGGEYTAINSTIQELIPARFRGWTDLLINGSFWVGAALGAGGSLVLLNPALINPAIGWRLAFLIGATIGVVILMMRLWIPILFGMLIDTGSQGSVAVGDLIGAALLLGAAAAEALWGVAAERESLETVAKPLAFVE